MRKCSLTVPLFGAAVLALVLPLSNPSASAQKKHWVGTWASSPQLAEPGNVPPAPGLSGNTLRQIIHVSIGGSRMRVRFSNAFGSSPLVLSSVHVALSAGADTIRTDTDKPLSFQGQPSVEIPAGALIYSDPLDFPLDPLSDLAVTIHFGIVATSFTSHPGSRETSFLKLGEDVSAKAMPGAATFEHWYVLNGLDVIAKPRSAAVAVLGDSITDGRNSQTNGNGRWPDDLARRLQVAARTKSVAVLNEGIGGNRLLHDGLGPNALARFDRDVLAQNSVRWLIVLEGINDLGVRPEAAERHENAPSAQELIAAFEQIILRAHSHNLRVYGATIMPVEGFRYFNPEMEADRQVINKWIRSSGAFDAVIDFDAVTRDPGHPTRLSPKVDSGDHLHPSNDGYQIMANAVDLSLFAK